jgi:hypothetical protein
MEAHNWEGEARFGGGVSLPFVTNLLTLPGTSGADLPRYVDPDLPRRIHSGNPRDAKTLLEARRREFKHPSVV